MLGTVVTRLLLKVTSAISNVTEYLTKKLSELLGVLTALKIQFVALLSSQLAQIVLKLKVSLVLFITLAQSIKLELINVARKILQTGQQLVTTVRQTLQAAKQVWKKDK